MIKVRVDAGFNPWWAAMFVLAEHGHRPAAITVTGDDGVTMTLDAYKYSKDWLRGADLAWANRPSVDGSRFRWRPKAVTVAGVPEELQPTLDAAFIRHVAASIADLEASRRECEVVREENRREVDRLLPPPNRGGRN